MQAREAYSMYKACCIPKSVHKVCNEHTLCILSTLFYSKECCNQQERSGTGSKLFYIGTCVMTWRSYHPLLNKYQDQFHRAQSHQAQSHRAQSHRAQSQMVSTKCAHRVSKCAQSVHRVGHVHFVNTLFKSISNVHMNISKVHVWKQKSVLTLCT